MAKHLRVQFHPFIAPRKGLIFRHIEVVPDKRRQQSQVTATFDYSRNKSVLSLKLLRGVQSTDKLVPFYKSTLLELFGACKKLFHFRVSWDDGRCLPLTADSELSRPSCWTRRANGVRIPCQTARCGLSRTPAAKKVWTATKSSLVLRTVSMHGKTHMQA